LSITFPAADGYPLAGTLFEPATGRARAAVLVNSATAVKRRYYGPFVAFLAESGFRVLTYDYRGVGDSRPERLRGFAARMQDWAEQDAEGALRFLHEPSGEAPLLLVGHSFGGQALGLMPGRKRFDAALLVATQSGAWRNWTGFGRLRLVLLWYGLIPVASRLCGYFPAKRLGVAEDLPGGVARQWAHWGRHRRYLLREGGEARRRAYAELTLPIRAYSFSDDPYAPRAAADHLLSFYSGARVEHRHLRPRDLGVEAVGHWGFFREACRDTLWPESLAWLGERATERGPRLLQEGRPR
jgi:predicted alpha/beta hydrolase